VGIYDFWDKMLDKYGKPWYNDTPDRETGSDSLTSDLLQKDSIMSNSFGYNTRQAKIHGLSVQVGELFANLYRDFGPEMPGSHSYHALEAYKSLRRLLPIEYPYDNSTPRHIGSSAAHKATQGVMR